VMILATGLVEENWRAGVRTALDNYCQKHGQLLCTCPIATSGRRQLESGRDVACCQTEAASGACKGRLHLTCRGSAKRLKPTELIFAGVTMRADWIVMVEVSKWCASKTLAWNPTGSVHVSRLPRMDDEIASSTFRSGKYKYFYHSDMESRMASIACQM
jgi:hypothetical protein